MPMKKVALKFCGGCDPEYDRVEYWQAIRSAAEGRIQWCKIDEGGFEAALVINGCPRECASKELKSIQKIKVVSVRENNRIPGDVVEELLADN